LNLLKILRGGIENLNEYDMDSYIGNPISIPMDEGASMPASSSCVQFVGLKG
jgi:hypothetical protein